MGIFRKDHREFKSACRQLIYNHKPGNSQGRLLEQLLAKCDYYKPNINRYAASNMIAARCEAGEYERAHDLVNLIPDLELRTTVKWGIVVGIIFTIVASNVWGF